MDVLGAFAERVRAVEVALKPLLDTPWDTLVAGLDDEEAAKLNLVLAYAVNSLFYMFLRTQNVSPADHPVRKELQRVQSYIEKLKAASLQHKQAAQVKESDRAAAQSLLASIEQVASVAEDVSVAATPSEGEHKAKKKKKKKKKARKENPVVAEEEEEEEEEPAEDVAEQPQEEGEVEDPASSVDRHSKKAKKKKAKKEEADRRMNRLEEEGRLWGMSLRRLYKLVHPDLFEQQPLARVVNEASMMKLNQWLDDRDAGRGAAPSLLVSFFVRASSTDGHSSLRRVDHVLAPHLSRQQGVSQLLTALGAVPDEDAEEAAGSDAVGLIPWLERHAPLAREALRSACRAFQVLDREEALYRHVLAQNRVKLSFKGLDQWTKKDRCASVAAAVALVDSLRDTATPLTGARLMLCKGAALSGTVDCMGRLVLDATQGPQQWAAAVNAATMSSLERAKSQASHSRLARVIIRLQIHFACKMAELAKQEADAAAALGVRLVTGETEDLTSSADYRSCLQRIIDHGPAAVRNCFPELSVLLTRNCSMLSPRSDMLYADVEEHDLHAVVAQLPIGALQKELHIRAVLEEQECQSRVFLKRKLRVAGLLRASSVSLEQSRACQQRLSVAGVTQLCAGLFLRIDSVYSVDDDGTLAIAWNCQ